jgi:GNAT superfamily N-acetyltransferase
MLIVRGIERGEVAAAVAIINEGTLAPGAEHPEHEDEYWAAVEEVRTRRGDVLVAVEDGVILGVCQVIVFRHFQHTGGWCAELESVYVRGDHRGQGIGAAMLDVAEGLARAAGCYRVQLTSHNVRVDAHRFYLTHGYEQSSLGFRKSLL